MSNSLFLDNEAKISFEKLGMAIRLSDNVDNWQREISSEIYKHLPFLDGYTVNVLINRVSPERGYAFGSAQVSNRKESPQPEGPVAHIPLLVTDRLLKPLDVFMFEGKAMPLNEERLHEALFDGRTFETSARKPVDQGMVDQLYPPVRTNYGYGAGVTTGAAAGGAGMGKFASLCSAIAPTVSEKDAEAMVDKIASDHQLTAAYQSNPAFSESAMAIAKASRVSVEKTATALVSSIKPTVVQFTKMADGNFKMKWANAEAFAPQEQMATPGEVGEMAGGDQLQALPAGESVTVGTEEAERSLDQPTPHEIKEFGRYEVQDESGQHRTGYVFPVIGFDMVEMPLMLFSDGESYSLQDEVIGVRAQDAAPGFPTGAPQGDGVFLYPRPDDSMVATMPLTVQNQMTDPEGNVCHICETAMGEQLQLCVAPGLNTIQDLGDGKYAIPDSMQWMPLQNPIHLTATPGEAEQVKEAQLLPKRGVVYSTGHGEFHVAGRPFEKLATEHIQFIDKAAAEFLLVSAGLTQPEAREKMAMAQRGERVEMDGLRTIIPLAEVHNQAIKEAHALLQTFPTDLRRDTIKLAAALEDSETADKILAMNFINPENVAIFASYLPMLDQSVQKLAEMLMAARMGMATLDEGALERAMNNLEQVIQGLKSLEQKQLL